MLTKVLKINGPDLLEWQDLHTSTQRGGFEK